MLHFSVRRGVQKRERSLVLLKPGYNLIVSCFALLYIGAIPVIIDPGMGLKSLLNCIKRTNPKNLIAIPIARSLALLFNASFSSIKTKISVNSKFEETLNNYSNTEKQKSMILKIMNSRLLCSLPDRLENLKGFVTSI